MKTSKYILFHFDQYSYIPLTNLAFSVQTVSYGSSLFPVGLWSKRKSKVKNSVRNLHYGTRLVTWLIRGMYEYSILFFSHFACYSKS